MQNIAIEYDYYTLEQAREIIKEENRQKAIRKAEKIYYIKQKLSGLTLAAIGILIPFIVDGDATASLLVLPMGLYLLFTKEKMMDF